MDNIVVPCFLTHSVVIWHFFFSLQDHCYFTLAFNYVICLQCFDATGWASRKASDLLNVECWDAGMIICLQWGANDLHMVQLMQCHSIIPSFIKIQIDLTFLVMAYPGCPGEEAVKWVFISCLSYHMLSMTRIGQHIKMECIRKGSRPYVNFAHVHQESGN